MKEGEDRGYSWKIIASVLCEREDEVMVISFGSGMVEVCWSW